MARAPVIEDGRTKAELDYLNEYARYLLAHKWLPQYLNEGVIDYSSDQVFWEHAKSKGWVSKREDKPLASGFKSAAAYLRR